MTPEVYRRLEALLSAVYPPTCLLCHAPGHSGMDICHACLEALPHNRNACARCALPLPHSAAPDAICGGCQAQPPAYSRCYGAFLYRDPISRLVSGLKFRGRVQYGRLLGQLLVDSLHRLDAAVPELLIPVPLHRDRIRQRGYNQSLEIARWVARALGVPLSRRACERQRSTAAQSDLTLKERRRNIRGAFAPLGPIAADHVAILDDVVTTGSTVSELAKVLKQAGAKRVDVWTIARTE